MLHAVCYFLLNKKPTDLLHSFQRLTLFNIVWGENSNVCGAWKLCGVCSQHLKHICIHLFSLSSQAWWSLLLFQRNTETHVVFVSSVFLKNHQWRCCKREKIQPSLVDNRTITVIVWHLCILKKLQILWLRFPPPQWEETCGITFVPVVNYLRVLALCGTSLWPWRGLNPPVLQHELACWWCYLQVQHVFACVCVCVCVGVCLFSTNADHLSSLLMGSSPTSVSVTQFWCADTPCSHHACSKHMLSEQRGKRRQRQKGGVGCVSACFVSTSSNHGAPSDFLTHCVSQRDLIERRK